MKAYQATCNDCETHEIVFAENAGKARSRAYGLDGLQDAEFIDISVKRVKAFDKFFDGKCPHLNFSDVEVQRVMRSHGWWIEENRSSCDCCGLYVYDDLEESHLSETGDGDICAECL